MRFLALLATFSLVLGAQEASAEIRSKALAIHHRLFTLDTHCDTPMRMSDRWDVGVRHEPGKRTSGTQDLVRMKEGGLDASFFAVFVGQGPRTETGNQAAWEKANAVLDRLDRMFAQHSDLCGRATTAAEGKRLAQAGKRAIFLGLENGYPLGTSVERVDHFFRRGVRYITLAHTADNDLAASSTEERDRPDGGLTDLGRKVVARMNDLGMVVDVSHISDQAFADVLKVSRAPVMASHSCARAIADHPRNLTDDQLRALKKNGGVIQLCILGDYIKPPAADSGRRKAERDLRRRVQALGGWQNLKDPKVIAGFEREWEALIEDYRHELPTVKDAVDHIDHIVKVIGIDHVGIGTDFDGGGGLRDCSDVTHLPRITEELLRRGYREADLAKIWGGNALRVLEAARRVAR